MRLLVLVGLLVTPLVANAQALEPAPLVSVNILASYDLVGPITLTPDTPGDELLFRQKIWRHVVVVAVPHPSKSGVGGLIPAPGLCIEPAQAFSLFDPQIAIADINGDGKQDVVGTANGVAQVLSGIGLSACR